MLSKMITMKAITVRALKSTTHPETKKLFWFMFAATRGGNSRIRIMSFLRDSPVNANRLSLELEMDYKGIQHHLKTLENNNLVTKVGNKYGITYFPSVLFEESEAVFDEIVSKLKLV